MIVRLFHAVAGPWLVFLAEDPMLRMLQFGMLLAGVLVVFLVFFTTRDILLRTNSFLWMFVSILLVAIFPIVGFLFYLLIRPTRTLKERECERMVRELWERQAHRRPEGDDRKQNKGSKERQDAGQKQ